VPNATFVEMLRPVGRKQRRIALRTIVLAVRGEPGTGVGLSIQSHDSSSLNKEPYPSLSAVLDAVCGIRVTTFARQRGDFANSPRRCTATRVSFRTRIICCKLSR